jgi:ABC-type branched-subunit amino acid transport system ATPase component
MWDDRLEEHLFSIKHDKLITMQMVFRGLPNEHSTESESIDLPSLTVITGLNGAGKTRFLEAIEKQQIHIEGIKNSARFDFLSFRPPASGSSSVNINIEGLGIFEQNELPYQRFYDNKVSLESETRIYLTGTKDSDLIPILDEKAFEERFFEHFANTTGAKKEILRNWETVIGKKLHEFDLQDFYECVPPTFLGTSFFQTPLERIFMIYHGNFQRNQYLRYLNTQGNSYPAVSDEEFYNKNGSPPWESLNRILLLSKSEYRVNKPPSNLENAGYSCRFTHTDGSEIGIEQFSSGERVLFALAMIRHSISNWKIGTSLPETLLLDEIDAVLHPSLTSIFLQIVQEELIHQQGMNVIMTTHSPSTVALAPEESIFVMHREGPKRLEKTTKDQALALLTRDVPTLSIEPENRRNVLVESSYDALAYEHMYNALKNKLTPGISLNFVGAGQKGNGNCDSVIYIVEKFATTGNKKFFGIVDWDYHHKFDPETQILVPGAEKRHSIENFAFDPIFIAHFLVTSRRFENFPVDKQLKGFDFHAFDAAKAQEVTNLICQQVKNHAEIEHKRLVAEGKEAAEEIIFDNQHDLCRYVNGIEVQIPRWYLRFRGHDLCLALKASFPALRRFNKENQEAHELLAIVAHELPEFIPSEILSLFKTIQGQ